jgi:hypothetical protein
MRLELMPVLKKSAIENCATVKGSLVPVRVCGLEGWWCTKAAMPVPE